jgi:hypothetical protein
MSCYSGGEQFLKPAGTGICAYNCTYRKTVDPSGHYCTSVTEPGCLLFCNTLGWGWNITVPEHELLAGNVRSVGGLLNIRNPKSEEVSLK